VAEGNSHLLSDVEVAIELLTAGYKGALVMVKVNS
jgi:formiminotetrahydrofolate cyclodeaminase